MSYSEVADASLLQILSPLRHLDTTAISFASQREARNREIALPPTSTYRWWARRTEAVNGAIIDAVALDRPGQLLVSDPFSGGGVIPLAAAIRGHKVYAQDLSSWAANGLATMLDLPDAAALREGIAALTQRVQSLSDAAYGTLLDDGTPGHVSHTFRVAVAACTHCGNRQRLYPHALVSLKVRAERNQSEAFLACPSGHLFRGNRASIQACPDCSSATDPQASYTVRRIIRCNACGESDKLETRAKGGLDWEVVLIERSAKRRRELDFPRPGELQQADDARWLPTRELGPILEGQETRVLRRHGFSRWQDLYPRRQRAFTEQLLTMAAESSGDPAVVRAIETAIVGSMEMAGYLSRWDRYYLKSYESMASHRFNFTTFSAEPNAWGTLASGRGTVLRRLVRLVKSSEWLRVRASALRTVQGPLLEPMRQTLSQDELAEADAIVVCGSSERQLLPSHSADLVLTDPPYHDDVQYSELSQPFRAWAGISGDDAAGDVAVNPATRTNAQVDDYSQLLSRIFGESARTLKENGHLIFSYANRDPSAWVSLISALGLAGLRASGAEILHSENETDQAKRNVRACSLDLIIDLVPAGNLPLNVHRPHDEPGDEGEFLKIVASYVLRIGALPVDWEHGFRSDVSSTTFLAKSGSTGNPGAVPLSAPLRAN